MSAEDTDPERLGERCRRCGRHNPSWSAPSPLWNAVMRGGSIVGDPLYDDLVCATCFMILAEEAGIAQSWHLTAETVNARLETETPSGRIWDDKRLLWVEPGEEQNVQVTQTPEISDCPFCGGEGHLNWRDGDRYFVECEDCEASTQYGTEDEAIAAWNHRTRAEPDLVGRELQDGG